MYRSMMLPDIPAKIAYRCVTIYSMETFPSFDRLNGCVFSLAKHGRNSPTNEMQSRGMILALGTTKFARGPAFGKQLIDG